MSIFSDLIGGLVGNIGDVAIKIRTAITGHDPATDAKLTEIAAQLETLKIQAESAATTAQTEINKIEAASSNLFVSGWRPFIGWTCGVALAFNYVIRPLAQWVILLIDPKILLPTIDLATMLPVLLGMLGLGAYRTYEKTKDVVGKH